MFLSGFPVMLERQVYKADKRRPTGRNLKKQTQVAEAAISAASSLPQQPRATCGAVAARSSLLRGSAAAADLSIYPPAVVFHVQQLDMTQVATVRGVLGGAPPC